MPSSAAACAASIAGAGAGAAAAPRSSPPPSPPRPPPRRSSMPSGFRLAAGSYARESHGHPIYCVAWSTDLHRESDRQRSAAAEAEAEQQLREGAESAAVATEASKDEATDEAKSGGPEECSAASSAKAAAEHAADPKSPPPSPATRPSPPPLLRCLATCGGRNVTLYETEASAAANGEQTPSSSSNGKGAGLSLRQAYVDPDDGELFYTCAFGGRGLGSACGYGRTADLVEDGRGRTIVLHAESSAEEGDDEEDDGDGETSAADSKLGSASASKKRRRDAGGDASSGSPGAKFGEGVSASVEADRRRHRALFRSLTDLSGYDGPQLLCAAGQRGVVKVIDTVRRFLLLTLSGHGDEIYDMKFSPADEWLLLTASKDESLRLWNVQTGTCVAIFAGHEGHRDAVLSVGWHPLGRKFASAGMDTTVKLWSLDGGEVKGALEESRTVGVRRRTAPRGWEERAKGNEEEKKEDGDFAIGKRGKKTGKRSRVFKTVYEQMPYFSTNKVHTDYVDCVQFVGDLVLSKSITDRIVLWKPDLSSSGRCPNDAPASSSANGGSSNGKIANGTSNANAASSATTHHQRSKLRNNVIPLREFTLNKCDVWFVRFQTDSPDCRCLAVGNNVGEVKVWDVGSPNPNRKYFANLTHGQCTSTVRMASFSPDGRSIVATCEDSTVWKWDAV